jgi:GT2 family glycosyltransferase
MKDPLGSLETPLTEGSPTANRRRRPRAHRPRAARSVSLRGKFFFEQEAKLYLRGVTYGAFAPGPDGAEYQDRGTIERDFALMAANGINTVRIPHTMPPRSLLDIAHRHGLRVMVGLSAEQHLGYLIDRPLDAPDIDAMIRGSVRTVFGHPALLAYSLGNEIPAPMARYLGARRVERYLERMYRVVRAADPNGLITYVNYPTTEYLRLPFLDFACFNVYLESQDRFAAYLARLQNLCGDKPLVMSELGLDGLRNGEDAQARSLSWQVRTAFAAGCAGTFIFSWTDEWYRHGNDVEDWQFGLTRADRSPKPALQAVREEYAEVPFSASVSWPSISVVVCSYNGASTIRDTLQGLGALDYPDYEVIVVDDGSTDETADIVSSYDCRLIRTPNRGLSQARNTGLNAANGEIVAYIDDDAYPDPHWLTYLASTFLSTGHAGVGGPNLAPRGDGAIAECVARAPGGPMHVLLTDREAEHIPGCNMAFRKAALKAIGGFDPQFRTAGDDVDACWQLQARGWTLGYHPGALVWHHRRGSIGRYWRQQVGYGRAEAMLERKWPEKYNGSGHVHWQGRIYGRGLTRILGWKRPRVYHGVWGDAPFQSLHEPVPSLLAVLPLMPEWHLMTATLAGLAGLSFFHPPFVIAMPLFAAALAPPVAQACLTAASHTFPETNGHWLPRFGRRLLCAALHLVQPMARLRGRFQEGLTPWRRRLVARPAPLWPQTERIWSETWSPTTERLRAIEARLRGERATVLAGEAHDRWDLEVRGGSLGAARLLMGAEDHPGSKQMLRLRWWPAIGRRGPVLVLGFAALAFAAMSARLTEVAALLAIGAVLSAMQTVGQTMWAMATLKLAIAPLRAEGD